MSYMNVQEIEDALGALAAAYPGVTELVPLPNRSVEGRLCHALRIGPDDASAADAAVILGGMHAREWVPPDALVNVAADLLEANDRGTGLRYGGKKFSAGQIRSIVERMQLVLFPCVNPDGRHHSQTADPLWRKNRRAAPHGHGDNCIGVDLNRNFDALWDFRRHFSPTSKVSASDNPCDRNVYVGPSAASEPETRNVVALIERYPRTRWFVDVHSFVPAIYYTWGFDENQTGDPEMNFRNPAFDGRRGDDGAYREFIPASDLQSLQQLSGRIHGAIAAVRGTEYRKEQSFSLYPTSGASDDYVYGRHFISGTDRILSFTIECGQDTFQPDWSEAEEVIREVSSGLLELCSAAVAPLS